MHFTSTLASWINQVERWFAEPTRKQLQRGVHRSTAELEADIIAFIKAHNENPKPCRAVGQHNHLFEIEFGHFVGTAFP